MMQLEQLTTEIEQLSAEEFAWLRQWFVEKDWEQWDRQLEADVANNRLDFLIDEAQSAKQQGLLRSL